MAQQDTFWSEKLASLRRVCLDSNSVIYLLENKEPYASRVAEVIQRMSQGRCQGVVSTLVELEAFVGLLRRQDRRAIDQAELFFRETPALLVRDIDRTVARVAAEVRAETGLRTQDALVAATALTERCDAIVGNDHRFAKRFTRVPYLVLENYAN